MTDRDARTKEIAGNEAAAAALGVIKSLVGKQALGVTSLEPTEDGWLVGVEVLEQRRVPSTSDILGVYEVEVDLNGELISYRRARRYLRAETGDAQGGTP